MDNKNQLSVFGRSLQLLNGDLVFDQNDVVTISGRDNFLQAIQIMIETPLGTDIFNINYGFDLLNIISQAQTVGRTRDLIRLNIVKSLSQDNRVREIREVIFDDEPRFFELNLEQDPEERRRIRKQERRWQAIVILQTISEGDVVLRLEGRGL